jgi:hypothetical protein
VRRCAAPSGGDDGDQRCILEADVVRKRLQQPGGIVATALDIDHDDGGEASGDGCCRRPGARLELGGQVPDPLQHRLELRPTSLARDHEHRRGTRSPLGLAVGQQRFHIGSMNPAMTARRFP